MVLKKRFKTIFSGAFMLFAGIFLLGACSSGGNGGGTPAATEQSISGIVSDPAIEGAQVVLVKLDGSLTGISAKSGADGGFTLAGVPAGSLSDYRLETIGGADTGTGEDFRKIALCLPLAMYTQYESLVISPLTCLVSAAFDGSDINAAIMAVKERIGDIDLTTDPSTDPVVLALAMKLTLMAAEGKSFQQILDGLDPTPLAGPETVNVALSEWAVSPDKTNVLAGQVIFNVVNDGPVDVHEFVVFKTDLAPDALPSDSEGVDEAGAGLTLIGEIEDIAVGPTVQTTSFNLAPGKYVLICNIWDAGELESHYHEGMRIGFTVSQTGVGIDDSDLNKVFTVASEQEVKDRLIAFFTLLDAAAGNVNNLVMTYQRELVEGAIRGSLVADLAALSDATEIANADANIDALVAHLISLTPGASRSYLMQVDVVATISGSGGLTIETLIADPASFDPTIFSALVLVNTSATFVDSLKIAYYSVDNPVTGNDQLVVYDGVTEQQTVVKTNVILGSRTFVFEGSLEGDKRIITDKKYGILLDPNLAQELRSAPDGRGGFFQYTFFFDNAFKRFDVASPSTETLIFDSSMLVSSLTAQGIGKIASDFTPYNNTNDPDNSYVALEAFETLPDLLKGEAGDAFAQSPIVIRLVDGKMTQGRLLQILEDPASGLTDRVLINFEAVHTPSSSDAFDERLQVCTPDLANCTDVPDGAGGFYTMTKNSSHIYLAKKGSETLFAFDVSAETLTAVTGVQYPAIFDPKRHLIGAAGHGNGGILSDFSSLSGMNTYLGDGPDAYLAINYDLDRDTKVGDLGFLGDIFIQKHAQILKFTGRNAVKIFDNGDGIDHGDASESESAVGHANLIAVKNGNLFVEIGNYDGISAGGSCTPSPSGLGCLSVRYGYLNTGSTGKTVLDTILVEKEGLNYMVSLRIAPVAMNDRLFVSILNVQGGRGEPHTYKLHRYDLLSDPVVELASSVGRSYMTKTAERDNGVFEGEVIAWDSETKVLANVTGNIIDLGSPEALIAAAGDSSALSSVIGITSGVPLAGIGNLVALRGLPGSYNWHLMIGDVNTPGGLSYVDQVPTSAWLYE